MTDDEAKAILAHDTFAPMRDCDRIAELEAALKDVLDYIDDELLTIVIEGRKLLANRN